MDNLKRSTIFYFTNMWEVFCCCLCCFITLCYLEFVMKQDVEILSLQGLFNPAPAHKNSHQD